jgi:hypothetical protein
VAELTQDAVARCQGSSKSLELIRGDAHDYGFH